MIKDSKANRFPAVGFTFSKRRQQRRECKLHISVIYFRIVRHLPHFPKVFGTGYFPCYKPFSGFSLAISAQHDLDDSKLHHHKPLAWFDAGVVTCEAANPLVKIQGQKSYECSNHLGYVMEVVSDRKLDVPDNLGQLWEGFLPDVLSYSDYYPFGMEMVGRNASTGDYRYGYQGSEKDGEISGEGNSYTTFFRQLDPRLGRWLSTDPKTSTTSWESPFSSMGDNPIKNVDPLGDRWFDRNTRIAARQLRQSYRQVLRTSTSTIGDRNEARAGIREIRALRRNRMQTRISVETVNPTGAYFTMAIIGGQNVLDVVVPAVPAGTPGSPNGYRNRSLGHEMKHAYQYITGKISFSGTVTWTNTINGVNTLNRGIGLLYDVEDEREAFRRGQVFDKTFWGFTRPAHITDTRLIAGSGFYARRPRVQLTTTSSANIINRGHANARSGMNFVITPPARNRAHMTYQTIQQTLVTPEIYVPQ